MSHLLLKVLDSPASALAGIDVEPRPLEGGLGASSGADDRSPHAVTKVPQKLKPVQKGWLWFGKSLEVDLSRANLTHLEEMMLNLP
jgi:hypothetical protein